ncbi:MAG: type VI secretion system protein TssA [Bryobacteraceae bacterium]|nr:type VI secretion system protein TssA [Bryobacteraceae bacterium]
MLLRNDILSPIPGQNPAGTDIRYAPVYEKIREARREDDQLNQGAWQRERKLADHSAAARFAQEAIATQSKDLQLMVWLADSMLARHGFLGFAESLTCCKDMLEQFWDGLYPELEEDDAESRSLLLDWLGSKLVVPVKNVPLLHDGYSYLVYKDSRSIIPEDQAKSKEQKSSRESALKEGKIAPEIIDKAVAETPKSAVFDSEQSLDLCLVALAGLEQVCQEKFGSQAPSLQKLQTALQEVRHTNHGFLQKKRETDPDPEKAPEPAKLPVEEPPVGIAVGSSGAAAAPALAHLPEPGTSRSAVAVPLQTAELSDRQQATASVAAAAAFLRAHEPFSAAPYLMLRGLRWGELRSSRDPGILEAPPTEFRQQIKSLALHQRWKELLEAAETLMSLPYGRAWLDLQRFVVNACAALGSDYDTIAVSIRSELRALLTDLPDLLESTLTDDSPVANAKTQEWLRDILAEPGVGHPEPTLARLPVNEDSGHKGWEAKYVDPHVLAKEAVRLGQHQKALEILNKEIDRQRSGRGRFLRKLQLAQICIAAGKDTIAQPLLDDLAAAVDTHKLEDWEDRELIAGALAFLLQSSKKIQADAKIKQTMFERICRLDPVQALTV